MFVFLQGVQPKFRHIEEAIGKKADDTVGKVEVEGRAVNLVTGWGLDDRLRSFGDAQGDEGQPGEHPGGLLGGTEDNGGDVPRDRGQGRGHPRGPDEGL